MSLEYESLPRAMPQQKPGRSKQTYGTPREFIDAVEKRFGKIICDLAAGPENTKCNVYYDEAANSLEQSWSTAFPDGVLWLNPPYKNIEEWARKCCEESSKRNGMILMLVPASIGSRWYFNYVHRKAMVLAIGPRLVFEGETSSFPKDLMLLVYSNGISGFDIWRYK